MGADIHVFLEYKGEGDEWRCGDFFFQSIGDEFQPASLYTGRNYALFDVLHEFLPQNGVPENLSALVKHEINRWTGSIYGLNSIMVSDLLKIWTKWEEKELLDPPTVPSDLWYNNGFLVSCFIKELMRNIDFITYRAPFPIGVHELRLVYFFDR